MSKYSLIFGLGVFLFAGCDQLGLDPSLNTEDCFTSESNRTQYSNLMLNEKSAAEKINGNNADPNGLFTILLPELVSQTQKEDLVAFLPGNIDDHEDYRKIDCDNVTNTDMITDAVFAAYSNDETEIEFARDNFITPEKFREKFLLENVIIEGDETTDYKSQILETIGQSVWNNPDIEVYIFPGVSRVPWANAEGSYTSDENVEKVIDKINEKYRELQVKIGLVTNPDLGVDLFDSSKKIYLYPHATFHQVFLSNYSNSLNNTENEELHNLVEAMATIEVHVINDVINKLPSEITVSE